MNLLLWLSSRSSRLTQKTAILFSIPQLEGLHWPPQRSLPGGHLFCSSFSSPQRARAELCRYPHTLHCLHIQSKNPQIMFFFFFFLSWSMVLGFPGGAHGKEPRLPVQETWDSASIPGNGNPVQYSCLENPMDRGAWQATVHGVTKAQTRLKWFSTQIVNFQCVRYSAKLVSGVSSRCSTKYSFSDTFPQQVITRYWI